MNNGEIQQEILSITNLQELLHDFNQTCDEPSLFISFLMECKKVFDNEHKKPKTFRIKWDGNMSFVFKLYNTKKRGELRISNYFFDGIETD